MTPPKLKILFVDDSSKRIHTALLKYADMDCRIAPNVQEALRLMSHEEWDVISLDHDLNGFDFQDSNEKSSGMEIVRYIAQYGWPEKLKRPEIIVHSSNAFAATAMVDTLLACQMDARWAPFVYDPAIIEWARG